MTPTVTYTDLGPLMRFRAEIERGLGRSIARPLSVYLDEMMGPVFEEAFRQHLRRMANDGLLGQDIVAVGSWWTEDGQQEIGAVVLAQQGLTRVPVLVGESKWASSVNGGRIKAGLTRKALVLSPDAEDLRYAVCARDSVEHADEDILTVTAQDIFGTLHAFLLGSSCGPGSLRMTGLSCGCIPFFS